jgi:hypothetical protein
VSEDKGSTIAAPTLAVDESRVNLRVAVHKGKAFIAQVGIIENIMPMYPAWEMAIAIMH